MLYSIHNNQSLRLYRKHFLETQHVKKEAEVEKEGFCSKLKCCNRRRVYDEEVGLESIKNKHNITHTKIND